MDKFDLMVGPRPNPMTMRELRIEVDDIKGSIRRAGRTVQWHRIPVKVMTDDCSVLSLSIIDWAANALYAGDEDEMMTEISIEDLSKWLDNVPVDGIDKQAIIVVPKAGTKGIMRASMSSDDKLTLEVMNLRAKEG